MPNLVHQDATSPGHPTDDSVCEVCVCMGNPHEDIWDQSDEETGTVVLCLHTLTRNPASVGGIYPIQSKLHVTLA